MSEVLAELTARYTPTRAMVTAGVSGESGAPPARRATRTYTGAALERRQRWGVQWGSIQRQLAVNMRERG